MLGGVDVERFVREQHGHALVERVLLLEARVVEEPLALEVEQRPLVDGAGQHREQLWIERHARGIASWLMPKVDLHLHLLPGVDDGCKTMEDSLELARVLVRLGYDVVAPSPHNRPEYASREVALAKLDEVRAEFARQAIALTLEPNAENFFLDETLLTSLSTSQSRRVGTAGKYLLVEAPYTSPLPQLLDVIFRMKLKGVTPLIAHPERCLEFEKKGRALDVVRAGAALQLDMGAVIGRYGKTAQKLSRQFLDDGLYALAATDLHSPVGAERWVGDSLTALEKHVGATAFTALVETHPRQVLLGQSVA